MRTTSTVVLGPIAGITLPAARQPTTHERMARLGPAASFAAAGRLTTQQASPTTGPPSTREKHASGKENPHV
jgi:hypothetical protein